MRNENDFSAAHQFGFQQPPARKPSGGVIALGILSIIYSMVFQICGSIIGLSLPFWVPALADYLENQIPDMLDLGAIVEGPFMAYVVISSFVSLILGLSFLFGGIGLLKLRPWGRVLSIGASVAAIVWNIINFLIGFIFVNPWVNRAMGQEYPHAPQVIGQAFGSFAGVVAQLALPIALLIFLTRTSMKEEFEPSPNRLSSA